MLGHAWAAGGDLAETSPRDMASGRPACAVAPNTRPGDLRGGARGLGLALLRGAGVELQQLILHGQLVPELRHLHTHTAGGDRSLPQSDRVPADAPALLRVNAYKCSLKAKARH